MYSLPRSIYFFSCFDGYFRHRDRPSLSNTFLSTLAATTRPKQRVESLGTFRLWRDIGYATGVILSGVIADTLRVISSAQMIGLITIGSSIVIQSRMPSKV